MFVCAVVRTCAVACVFGRVLGSLRLAARVAASACEWACVRALRHGGVTSDAPGNSHCFATVRVCHHLRGYVNEALLFDRVSACCGCVCVAACWWDCWLRGCVPAPLTGRAYLKVCVFGCMCLRARVFVSVCVCARVVVCACACAIEFLHACLPDLLSARFREWPPSGQQICNASARAQPKKSCRFSVTNP